jgi:glyoxylase-like metal-dependent hydrolase (beta-lactamase superfamily II)
MPRAGDGLGYSGPMEELRPGLWYWCADHPQWTTEDDLAEHQWGPEVTSYAMLLGDRLVLIDPVIPSGGLDDLLGDREVSAVLTCPWHARDSLILNVAVHAPPPEPEDTKPLPARNFSIGQSPVPGITAFPGLEPMDLVLWVESHRALVFGDTLVDLGRGLELPDDWGPSEVSHSDVLQTLRERLELPIELALPTHGLPADRAAFERAVR